MPHAEEAEHSTDQPRPHSHKLDLSPFPFFLGSFFLVLVFAQCGVVSFPLKTVEPDPLGKKKKIKNLGCMTGVCNRYLFLPIFLFFFFQHTMYVKFTGQRGMF